MLKLVLSGGNNWQDKRVIKAALLGFIKVLKCYQYSSTPEQYMKAYQMNDVSLQNNIHNFYNSYFTNESMSILENLIQVIGISEGGNEEDILE